MRGNTIILHLQKGTVTRTGSLYQYDYGQRLVFSGVTLPEAYEVHFSNSDLATSKTMIGDATGVDIPDEYLLTGAPVYVWVYLHTGEDDGETEYHGIISVLRRAQPTDQEPTPVQQDVITQTIASLNTAVEEAEAAAASLKNATATAETLAPGSSATATLTENDGVFSFEFGIPQGAKGDQGIQGERGPQGIQGIQGEPGQDGKDGADGKDGQDGAPGADGKDGQDGADGYTPVKGTDYWTDSDKAEIVADASAAVENDIIDDSAGTGDTGKVWSADKSASVASGKYELPSGGIPSTDLSSGVQSSLGLADSAYQKPSGGIPATDLASGVIPDVNSKAPVIIDTASGAIASFPDGADNLPVESLVVNIEPVQSGSGDPSPENVRPITGWTGVAVYASGINVWDEQTVNGIIVSSGNVDSSTSRLTTSYIPVLPNTTYYQAAPSNARYGRVAYYDRQKNVVSVDVSTGIYSMFTTPDNAYFMRITFGAGYGVTYKNDISINYPSTDTDYHPHFGTTIPVTFPEEAGTVYGGTLNLTTGVLTVNFVGISTTWGDGSNGTSVGDNERRRYTITGAMAASDLNGSVNEGKRFCSIAPWSWSYYGDSIHYYVDGDTAYVTLPPSTSSSTAIQIVAMLATPITYQLTPTKIKTLLGQNNIWADAGNVEVAYRADTKLFCQKNATVDWELIADVTLAEDSDTVSINTDTNGQSFVLSKFLARIWLKESTTQTNNYIRTSVRSKLANGNVHNASSPAGRWPANGAEGFNELYSELICDCVRSEMRYAATSTGNSQNVSSSSTEKAYVIKAITGLDLEKFNSTSSPLTAGTQIKLYGIRIDE